MFSNFHEPTSYQISQWILHIWTTDPSIFERLIGKREAKFSFWTLKQIVKTEKFSDFCPIYGTQMGSYQVEKLLISKCNHVTASKNWNNKEILRRG